MAVPDPDTRERILDAAKNVFLERGTSGARMQDIADAAEVNKALLHYYFQNKDNLSGAVFQRELGRLIQPVLQTLGSDLPLEEKVRTAIDLYLARLSAFPLMPGYVLAEIHFHPDRLEALLASVADVAPREIGTKVFAVLGRQIDDAVAAGRMRPISPHQFLVNLVSLCVFPFAARPLLVLVTGGDEHFDAMIEERRETLADFFLGALRP
jgi:AcrR family transcriptional regulator